MIEVSMSTALPASPDEVWKKVGGFGALHTWHPAVQSSEVEGRTRRLHLAGGTELVEELVDSDEAGHSYTYRIIDAGPLPVEGYESTIRVEGGKNGGSTLTWSSRFEPVGDPMAARSAIEGIYQAGFDNIGKLLS